MSGVCPNGGVGHRRLQGSLSTVYVDKLAPVKLSTENVEITAAQCRGARAFFDITQPELASKAGLGLSTVIDFERSRRPVSAKATAAICAALEAAGVEFTIGHEPGVKLRETRAQANEETGDRKRRRRPRRSRTSRPAAWKLTFGATMAR